jgi:hypothetical protein
MATPDLVLQTDECTAATLPLNPFVSNRYHFGMLLGVADLDTEQGYHRGKSWLHNAWLHGPGTVWGLGVEVRADAGEVVVLPGLALDANGRELQATDRLCLDLGRWFVERRPDDLEVTEQTDGSVTFTVHVRLCARQCLDRPVPSVSEPCEGSDLGTAYSRTVEQALPSLAAGPAPADPVAPYPRLRQLAGQLPATDQAVTDALAAVGAAADTDRPGVLLGWFRRLAALDAVELQPEDGVGALFPVAGDGCVVLAQVDAHLRPDGDRWVVVDDTAVDNAVRPAHVRTRTIQELLLTAPAGVPGAQPDAPTPADAAADPPRAASAELSGSTLTVRFTGPLLPATVTPDAFAVTALRSSGWAGVTVTAATLDDTGTAVDLRLRSAPRVRPVRVVARGAGPAPLLGADGQPLSGTDADGRTVRAGEDAALQIGTPGTDSE